MKHMHMPGAGLAVVGLLVGSYGAVVLTQTPAAAITLCGGVAATIQGTMSDDDLIGTTGGRRLQRPRPGDDTIRGGGGNDRICGDDGEDVIHGQDGGDRIYGGAGRRRDLRRGRL